MTTRLAPLAKLGSGTTPLSESSVNNQGPLPPQFEDYKRRHSKQNRDIIRENANRLILNRNLQEEIGRLHVKLLEEKAEKVALGEELRRTKEELGRIRNESSKEALDAILAAVPALKQLRHKLGPSQHPSYPNSIANSSSSRRRNPIGSEKTYPEVNPWEQRPDVVAAGKPVLDDVVEATERGSESDWSCGDGGRRQATGSEEHFIRSDSSSIAPKRTPSAYTSTKTSRAVLSPAKRSLLTRGMTDGHSPSRRSPSKESNPLMMKFMASEAAESVSASAAILAPTPRVRGRRESAMFARDAKSPSPELGQLHSPFTREHEDASNVAKGIELDNKGASSPPPPPSFAPDLEPAFTASSPLRRSPRKPASRVEAARTNSGMTTSGKTAFAVVDTGLVELDDTEKIRRGSLLDRRRSVAVPISYAEEVEEDDVEDPRSNGRTTSAPKFLDERASEGAEVDVQGKMKRKGDKQKSEAVSRWAERVSDRTLAMVNGGVEPPGLDSTRCSHDATLAPSANARPNGESESERTASTSIHRSGNILDGSSGGAAIDSISAVDAEVEGSVVRLGRRSRVSVSYKEPSLNTKMRKPDGSMGIVPSSTNQTGTQDRSRGVTPSDNTLNSTSRTIVPDTPSALPSDLLEEHIVESIAGTARAYSLNLDARSSNVRRKSVLPSSRRDEVAIRTANSRPASNNARTLLPKMTTVAAMKRSDIARAYDLPSSPDENGTRRGPESGDATVKAPEASGYNEGPSASSRVRRPLAGIAIDAMSGMQMGDQDRNPSSLARGVSVSSNPKAAAEAAEPAGVKRTARRQSGVVRG